MDQAVIESAVAHELHATEGPPPKVTMGMPVFNGEHYLEQALRSLLAQTFEDFEIVISDNASIDRTGEICLDYAASDRRIRYLRNEVNIGLGRNQNRVYELARGQYFLLTHHDDLRASEYLAKTVPVLDNDPTIVICYTVTQDIDEHGQPLPRRDPPLRFDSPDFRARFRDVIRMDHICEPDFGLSRMSALRATRLHGLYADSDRVLLAELALQGRFYRLPELLFFRRDHSMQSTAIAPDRQSRTVWFDPRLKGKLVFPHFRQLAEYLVAIRRSPLSWRQQASCHAEIARWTLANRRRLANDTEFALKQLLRPAYYALRSRAVRGNR